MFLNSTTDIHKHCWYAFTPKVNVVHPGIYSHQPNTLFTLRMPSAFVPQQTEAILLFPRFCNLVLTVNFGRYHWLCL